MMRAVGRHILETIETWTLRSAAPLATLLVPLAIFAIFFWVPTDAGLGISQRIFYFHVPCATSAFLCFALAGATGLGYLRSSDPHWDHASSAAVSTGMLFGTLVLMTGSIWARTAWGTWWTWDARLTTFLVLWLVFASYLTLRTLARGNDMMPRYAAVLAIVGAINIPLVMMATRLWRTIHPQVIRNPDGGIQDPRMATALGLSMIAVMSVCLWFWAAKMRLARLEQRVESLEREVLHSSAG
jgi:heme exporter protein C